MKGIQGPVRIETTRQFRTYAYMSTRPLVARRGWKKLGRATRASAAARGRSNADANQTSRPS